MDIRKPDDLELKRIYSISPQAIYDGTLGEVKPTNEKIEQLIDPILEKGGYYLRAVEDDKIMGWILLGAGKDKFTDKINGFIHELFVLNEFRGKGISKQLMKAGIDQLKQDGYSEIRHNAFAENPAVKLYERMGFHVKMVSMSLSL
ncbi:GNAT family N-acetyltransferase [Bacillus sp. FJAT-27445]|uniref:GNAT family N-acetyltransferase n=1 Tax=Bacillus sp. FJAT-27445 TaxID=1679166 RepID=UPI000743BB46|nr:GNAT family N-acetyltransferase [Bacillus sp. FJAT-27445]